MTAQEVQENDHQEPATYQASGNPLGQPNSQA
jgi:hypothetical protein